MTEQKTLQAAIEAFIEDYEFRGDWDYRPNQTELMLINDAIQGLIEDEDFIAAWNRRSDSEGAAPSSRPVDWSEAQRICDLPIVDEAIRNLLADQTGDNATCMVRAIIEAAKPVEAAVAAPVELSDEQILELAHEWTDEGGETNVIEFARSLLAAQTKTPHGLPSDK